MVVDDSGQEYRRYSVAKFVNVVTDGMVVRQIELPGESEVKNFSLNSAKKTARGFTIVADWGGWQWHYELQYFFVCKDQDFYFNKFRVHRVLGKDPGKPGNWETKEIKIEPNIPVEQFSMQSYLGDQ